MQLSHQLNHGLLVTAGVSLDTSLRVLGVGGYKLVGEVYTEGRLVELHHRVAIRRAVRIVLCSLHRIIRLDVDKAVDNAACLLMYILVASQCWDIIHSGRR